MEMHSVFSDSHPPPHASASLKRMTGVLFSSVCIFFIVVEVKEWVEGHENFIRKPPKKKQHQVCYLILVKISQLPLQKQPIVSDLAICSLIQCFFCFLFFPTEMAGLLPWYLCVGLEEILIIFDTEYSIKPCHPRHWIKNYCINLGQIS